MSERERVMDHLHTRIMAAFSAHDDATASDLNDFLNSLELMDDEEYNDVYGDDFARVGR